MAQYTSASRAKRAGEDFARQHENTSKKPRFDYRNPSTLAADAPENDIILDADVIGKSGPQTKRNAVNIDGYESDSDNDNFNARAAERERRKNADGANGARSKDEDEDDMFADVEEGVQGTVDGDDDEELTREGKKRKKDVRFLDRSEIVGQVMNSTSGGHVSSDLLMDQKGKKTTKNVESSSESGSDEERDMLPDEMEEDLAAEIGAGGKKRHAPRLDAFNLKQEEEEGRYDESGNFVRKAVDPDAVNDNWLDGLSKKDMRRAKEAQEKRDSERKRKDAEDDATLTSDLLSRLIAQLETGETPLEALQRLQKGQKVKARDAKVPKWKQKKLKDKMEVDEPAANGNGTSEHDEVEEARKISVEAITAAADALYSREQQEVYDTEREMLMRQYKRETGEDWQALAADSGLSGVDIIAKFEYRWSDARDGGENHGPYDGATMKAWSEAGYFGEGVEFRRIGEGEWSRVLDIP
jgi:CD2 antigen cytoplasmic tail-binding protein 2